MKFNISNFTKNDWDHMHDCILDATWDSIQKNCSREELVEIFNELPKEMQLDAYKWGMSDTVWRDNLIEWYERNGI